MESEALVSVLVPFSDVILPRFSMPYKYPLSVGVQVVTVHDLDNATSAASAEALSSA